ALKVSAKDGKGVAALLDRIVERVPHPKGDPKAPLRALIIDSWFDNYLGVVCLIRMVDGVLRREDKISFMATNKEFTVDQLGVQAPEQIPMPELNAGDVGYVSASIKSIQEVKIGDTITNAGKPAQTPLPGFVETKPMV